MSSVQEIIESLRQKLADKPEQARAIGAVYKFALEGEGGGTYILNVKDEISITPGDGDAGCTISMAASDFVDLMEGRANGQQLFFSGKLRIEGDMSLALKLQQLPELMH